MEESSCLLLHSVSWFSIPRQVDTLLLFVSRTFRNDFQIQSFHLSNGNVDFLCLVETDFIEMPYSRSRSGFSKSEDKSSKALSNDVLIPGCRLAMFLSNWSRTLFPYHSVSVKQSSYPIT